MVTSLAITASIEVAGRSGAARRTAGRQRVERRVQRAAGIPREIELRRRLRSLPRRPAHRRRGRRTDADGRDLSLTLEQRHARQPVRENPGHDAAGIRRARSARTSRLKSSPICSSRTASPPERASSRPIFQRSTNCASRAWACGTASSRRPRPSAEERRRLRAGARGATDPSWEGRSARQPSRVPRSSPTGKTVR